MTHYIVKTVINGLYRNKGRTILELKLVAIESNITRKLCMANSKDWIHSHIIIYGKDSRAVQGKMPIIGTYFAYLSSPEMKAA
jgi:hypothetical protein